MNYPRIIRAIENECWAIKEEALDAICEFIRMKSEGVEIAFDAPPPREPQWINATNGDGAKKKANGIAILPIYGVITQKVNLMSQISGGTSLSVFQKQFRQAMADPEIATVVLDFDSPGGGIFGLEEMSREIYQANKTKRIISVGNPMTASAALWLATQSGEFYASPSSESGSLGVFALHQDYSKHLDEAGIKTTYIRASGSPLKAESPPEQPLSDDAKNYIQNRVDTYFDVFLRDVSRGRRRSPTYVKENFGKGRMLGSGDALRVGMIDGIATLDQVISRLQSPKSNGNLAENDQPEPIADEFVEDESVGLSDEDRMRRMRLV